MGTPEAHRSWIDWNLASHRNHRIGLWVIETTETGESLGDCGLTLQEASGQEVVEVGYHLKVSHRGNGYAT